MAKHLTDKQKKQIIADYATLENYAAVARKNKTSATTVRRILEANPETVEIVRRKKKETTEDILQYMERQKKNVTDIIGLYLDELKKPERISKASVQSLAVSLGIVIDKFTGTPNEIEKLKAEIAKIRGEQTKQEIHPLIADMISAIKERQENEDAEQ